MRVRTTNSGRVASSAALSNAMPKRRSSPLPFLVVLVLVGAGGYFGWKAFESRQAAKRARAAEYQRLLEERERRLREEAAAKEKPPEKPVVVEEKPPEPPPPPPKKSEAEILREEETLRKEVWAKIEEARKSSTAQPLGGFAGIRFGEPIGDGQPVKWGTVLEESAGDSVEARGAAFALYGPVLKKPFMSMGSRPLVWVTPKTRRPYRIEFSRAIAPRVGTKHDPEATNLVAILGEKFKCEAFAPKPCNPDRPGCEYVFPLGVSTVSVGEFGDTLMFSVEREDIRAEAKAESEAMRQAKRVVSEDGKVLDSTKYPHKPIDRAKYRGVRFKDETPRAFCGIVFASGPAETAQLVNPQKGAKGFFINYTMGNCRPFRGFSFGKADTDPVRGGVYAISLSSEGGTEGQDDKEYYESVRSALSGHYKVEPEKKGTGDLPELTYRIGDLVIVFGPDSRGGFMLRAENTVLAKMAGVEVGQGQR